MPELTPIQSTPKSGELYELLESGPIPEEGKQAYGGAHFGVSVLRAETGERLLDVRGGDALTPASNQKLIITSAALYTLGPDFRFQTQVLAPALEDGYLEHLTLRGEGDPSLRSVGKHNSLEVLARQLYAAGVRRVGAVRVDDFAFSWPRWGSGWMWDDPAYPIGAVFLEGAGTPCASLATDASPNPGLVTDLAAYPAAVGRLLQNELTRVGTEVSGPVVRARAGAADTVLARVRSRPLLALVRDTNKASLNHYAEQLYARLGLAGPEATEPSTPDTAYAALGTFLAEAGIDIEALRVRDGSGLSRYNLVTPRQLATLLYYLYQNPLGTEVDASEAFANPFIVTLPVAGTAGERGGTLASRLVGSGLTVYAKTGSLTGVSSLSGYLRAASGRDLVFSLLMAGYPGPLGDLQRLQDALLVALARAN